MEESKINFFRSSLDTSEFTDNSKTNDDSDQNIEDWKDEFRDGSFLIEYEDDRKPNQNLEKDDSNIENTDDFSFKYRILDPYLSGMEPIAPKNFTRHGNYEDLELTEEEGDGVLTDRIIEVSSSNLEKSVRPGKFVLANCDLSRKSLKSINIIKYHQFLRFVDLSRNLLTSLEALGSLHFLTYLDVSFNLLSSVLDFKAPINLTQVIYSNNLVENIDDLSDFWTLIYLDISYNSITEIQGLHNLRYLNYLNLSRNQIKTIKNLEGLRIETLLLNKNEIGDFEMSFQELFNLRFLDLSCNNLRSLKVFEQTCRLECVNITNNKIENLIELEYFKGLRFLNIIDLRGNPICNNRKYQSVCIKVVKSLILLDGKEINPEEAGLVRFTFEHSIEKEAGINNVPVQILENLKKPQIDSTVVPGYKKLVPLLILVGPTASKKNRFVSKICAAYSKIIVRGVSYTTRPKCSDEESGVHYHFISEEEFKKLIEDGELMCCTQKYGYYFGIGWKEIKKVSENVGILLFHCDLFSALQVKSKFPNTSIIFTISKSEIIHKKWLTQKFYFSPWISRYIRAYILQYFISRETQAYTEEEKQYYRAFIGNLYRKNVKESKKEIFKDIKLEEPAKSDVDLEKPSQLVPILKTAKRSISEIHQSRQNVSFSTEISSMLISEYDGPTSPLSIKMSTSDSFSESLVESVSEGRGIKKDDTDDRFILTQISSPSLRKASNEFNESVVKDLKKLPVHSPQYSITESENVSFQPSSKFKIFRSDSFKDEYWLVNSDEVDDEVLISISDAVLVDSESIFFLSKLSDTIRVSDDKEDISDLIEQSRSNYPIPKQFSINNMEDFFRQSSIQFKLYNSSEADLDNDRSKLCMEYFLNKEIIKRNKYLDVYCKYPGLFIASIHPDEEIESFKKIQLVLKNCVQAQKFYAAETQFKNKLINPDMKKARIDMLHNLLK